MDAARRHVGRHQHLHPLVGEGVEGGVALPLGATTMDPPGLHAETLQLTSGPVDPVTGPAEHDGRPRRVDHVGGEPDLVLLLGADEPVGHRAEIGLDLADLTGDRIVLVPLGHHTHLVVEGGGEQHGLALRRREIEDATHHRQEAHVGHAIGLVDHDEAHVRQLHLALGDQVLETTWAGDDQIDAGPQGPGLRAEPDAAVDGDDRTIDRRAQRLERTSDLVGELARRGQHQTGRATLLADAEASGEGDTEGEGLARAGGGSAEHVPTVEGGSDRLGLDGERLVDSSGREGIDERCRHAEIGERRLGAREGKGVHGVLRLSCPRSNPGVGTSKQRSSLAGVGVARLQGVRIETEVTRQPPQLEGHELLVYRFLGHQQAEEERTDVAVDHQVDIGRTVDLASVDRRRQELSGTGTALAIEAVERLAHRLVVLGGGHDERQQLPPPLLLQTMSEALTPASESHPHGIAGVVVDHR